MKYFWPAYLLAFALACWKLGSYASNRIAHAECVRSFYPTADHFPALDPITLCTEVGF